MAETIKVTMTHALQDVNKTIPRRLGMLKKTFYQYLLTDVTMRDPFKEEGGVKERLRNTREKIGDLESRWILVRIAIQGVNLRETLLIEGIKMSVAGWLVWKREVAKGQAAFLDGIVGRVEGSNRHRVNVNVDEGMLIDERDKMQRILGQLDAALSVFNANTDVEIPKEKI